MNTTKNEQYHILSPEWLKTNPLPEDGFRLSKACGGKWSDSSNRGRLLLPDDIERFHYSTRRTDLPPEAYATPPTDTTGSGREGETVDINVSMPSKVIHSERVFMKIGKDGVESFEAESERKVAELTAQVEALRRGGERLRNNALREGWRAAITLANNVCVRISDELRDDDGPCEAINVSSDCAAQLRKFIEPDEQYMAEMITNLEYWENRAAIDSAQRQEGR